MQASAHSPVCFSPQGELGIYNAAELKQQLLQLLDASESVVVDLSKVTMLDTAGLQLLVLVRKEAQRRGKALGFTGPSEAVTEVIDLCNMSGVLGEQEFLPAAADLTGAQA